MGYVLKQILAFYSLAAIFLRTEAYIAAVESVSDDAFNAHKSATTDKENMPCIDLNELLFGMFASTLRRNVHIGTFQKLEQTLLYAFATYVTRNGRIVTLSGYFVYFVNKYDTSLGRFHIVIRSLE